MQPASSASRDPLFWCAVLTVLFLALVWHRLGMPPKIYFDEVHYIPAARKLLELRMANPEHPPFGKEVIAAAIALLGDKPLYWRVPSALLGALGLFAFSRALWWASRRAAVAIAGTFLVATSFLWFIQSRIAMLDMVMASMAMVALWMFISAMALPRQGRWRLALCGLASGLAMAAKWSVAPLLVLPGLIFLALKLRDGRGRFLIARDGGPVPGITLIEAGFWLGVLPIAVYWLTFLPNFFYVDRPVSPLAFIEHHRWMLELQDSVKRPHPYRSVWYQWVVNWRAMWYLYDPDTGVQRGVLLIGNPFTMLAGLPAVLWCLWAGIKRRRLDCLGFAGLYVVAVAFWPLSGKPVQFYYHYLLPSVFLMACLALALDDLWQVRSRWRWLAPASLAAAAGVFVYFYPIISAAALPDGRPSYVKWMWLHSWR